MVKKLLTASLGIGMVLATVAPVFAVNTCDNRTTGPRSVNVCTRLLNKFNVLNVTNNGTVNQTINHTANSGNNTSNDNTVGGNVTVGGAKIDVLSTADLNSGNATLNQTDPAVDDQGSNNVTGPDSNNTVNFTTNKTVNVTVQNDGVIRHTVNAVANSGGNSANNNTGGGSVNTGTSAFNSAEIISTILSSLNSWTISITQ